MIDKDALPDFVRKECEEFQRDNPSSSSFASMSAMECFEQFLQWNGIIGYTELIVNALDGCRAAEVGAVEVNDDEYRQALRTLARHEISKVRAFYHDPKPPGALTNDEVLNFVKLGMDDGLVDEVFEVVKEVLDGK